jgi:transposase
MDRIAMTPKELGRVRVLSLVVHGHLAMGEAAEKLALSKRHVRRLVGRLRARGPGGLAHANRGRPAPNRLPNKLRTKVLRLARTRYLGINDTHLVELLAEREAIRIGRETLRSLLRANAIAPKRKRRPPRHHRRRERSPAKGLMVLWDGSPHHWLGKDKPQISLLAAVDDADGELLAALFAPTENALAYLQLLRDLVQCHGLPISIYQDRHSALRRNDDSWSLEEQLAGRQRPTQVGLALEELGIRSLFALSPQAKGRVERLFGTLQDRLLAEMQLDHIHALDDANRYLQSYWIERFNRRFRKPLVSPQSVFRSAKSLDLHKAIAFRYFATVANDNCVRLGALTIDIPPGPRRRSFAKALVDVRQHLDGSWSVYFHRARIALAPSSLLVEPLYRSKFPLPRNRRARGARDELALYLPPLPPPKADSFARQLGGQIASA